MKRANMSRRMDAKRASAQERQARWDSLSVAQKIADLDRRLGDGVGASKQRAKLLVRAESEADKASKKAKEARKASSKSNKK
jgi:hypothetical protein